MIASIHASWSSHSMHPGFDTPCILVLTLQIIGNHHVNFLFYLTDYRVYPTDNHVYPMDDRVYFMDNCVHPMDVTVHPMDDHFYPKDNRVYPTDNLVFSHGWPCLFHGRPCLSHWWPKICLIGDALLLINYNASLLHCYIALLTISKFANRYFPAKYTNFFLLTLQ